MIAPLSASNLMRQANSTAGTYFNGAVRVIDEKFGEGYTRENPGLVGDFMKTAAHDFSAVVDTQQSGAMIQAINDLACSVGDMPNSISEQMSKSSEDHLEGLTRVSKSIDDLASVVEGTAEPKGGK